MTITSRQLTKPSKVGKELITTTIENHPEGVLSTINTDGTPSSSVITLHKFNNYHYFFMTKDTTKKYDNLEYNPNITFMIFDPFSRTELEIKGICEYIWDEKTRKKAYRILEKDTAKGRHHVSPFVKESDTSVLFSISPQSIHFTTFWDRGDGPEMYQKSIEFEIQGEQD